MQEVLIGTVPALLTVQIRLELPAYLPLMFHGFLRNEISHAQDTDHPADTPGGSRADSWGSLLIGAVRAESGRICHLLSDH